MQDKKEILFINILCVLIGICAVIWVFNENKATAKPNASTQCSKKYEVDSITNMSLTIYCDSSNVGWTEINKDSVKTIWFSNDYKSIYIEFDVKKTHFYKNINKNY